MLMPSIFGENLLDDFFSDFVYPQRTVSNQVTNNIMRTDVMETEDGFELDIDLPGFKKEDVKAQIKDGYLTINAETKSESEEKKDGKFIRRERFSGSCQRRFYVGKYVSEEDIKARFEDGILKVNVPKKEALPDTEKYIAIEG